MARLIDADAFIADYCKNCGGGCDLDDECCTTVDDLMKAPTVDAVPVVHGRCKWCNGDYHTKIMATAIRYHTNGNMDGYEVKVNYCPNCGAKMDAKE